MMKAGSKDRDKAKKKGFVYKERTAEDAKKRADQTGGMFDSIVKSGTDTWRPKPGDNTIRILPPTWESHEHFGLEVFVHTRIGPDNSTYLCPRKQLNKDCPICDASREAQEAGEIEESKALAPKKQVLYYIIDRLDRKPKLYVYIAPWTIDRDIASLTQNKKSGGVIFIDHPDEGYDVMFKRTGTKKNTKYFGFQIDRDPTPLDDDPEDQQEFLDAAEAEPLPDVLHYRNADYLAKQLAGTSAEKDEDLDEDDKPKKKKRRDEDDEEEAPKRRARRDDPDDEEEKPKRRRVVEDDEEETTTKKRRRVVEEDEEEEEAPKKRRAVADDDEEEEAPKGKNTRTSAKVGRESSEADLKKTRRARDEDEEEPAPKKNRIREEDDEEEEKPKRRAARDEDDEEEEKPKRRVARDEEDEEEAPKKRSRREEPDEEDEPTPKKGRRGNDDDEEEEKPKRRRVEVDEEEEEEAPKRVKSNRR